MKQPCRMPSGQTAAQHYTQVHITLHEAQLSAVSKACYYECKLVHAGCSTRWPLLATCNRGSCSRCGGYVRPTSAHAALRRDRCSACSPISLALQCVLSHQLLCSRARSHRLCEVRPAAPDVLSCKSAPYFRDFPCNIGIALPKSEDDLVDQDIKRGTLDYWCLLLCHRNGGHERPMGLQDHHFLHYFVTIGSAVHILYILEAWNLRQIR